jgi:hypothetical protein
MPHISYYDSAKILDQSDGYFNITLTIMIKTRRIPLMDGLSLVLGLPTYL